MLALFHPWDCSFPKADDLMGGVNAQINGKYDRINIL